MPFFRLLKKDKNSNARLGEITTDHGVIQTPVFMPVGTQAAVKTLDSADLAAIKAQIILGNNYHLHLRPGEDVIAQAGGLHTFMNWNGPILTDSGGFQVFSLGLQKKRDKTSPYSPPSQGGNTVNRAGASLAAPDEEPARNGAKERARSGQTQGRLTTIDEDGVTFRSHIDGSTHRFTPESAIECQHKLGADIIMAFDECTPDDADTAYARAAMERTHRWAERSLAEHKRLGGTHVILNTAHQEESSATAEASGGTRPAVPQDNRRRHRQFLFGIIQGAQHKDLREKSAKYIATLDFDGIAIGGESIGYNMAATADILDWVYPLIPENKPHYAMGVGLHPTDLLIAVEHGVDMFDCVAPTRLARHGMLFVSPWTSPSSILHQEESTNRAERVVSPLYQEVAAGRRRGDTNKHRLNIRNAAYAADFTPVDAWCDCSTCATYTRAYLHHLFDADEITALRLASIHNLRFLLKLMEETRAAIREQRFRAYRQRWQ